MANVTGTDLNDTILGTAQADILVGRGGDDNVQGAGGNDHIVGDYLGNLLEDTEDSISFSDYAVTDNWSVTDLEDGHTQMAQTVDTVDGAVYEIEFDIAANLGAGAPQGAVEVLWNSEVIGTFQADDGIFQTATVSFTGTGDPGELIFRSIDPTAGEGPVIDTSGPIYSYDTVVEVNGEEETVAAFAEGQPNLYQVMNGTLMVFDPETNTYTKAGEDASVVVNGIGFNQEDNLVYGIAVKDGEDSLGNDVAKKDLIMLDADGKSYNLGPTPYRSWTADFDDKGNLWAFEADLDYFMKVDVSEKDDDGNPETRRRRSTRQTGDHRHLWRRTCLFRGRCPFDGSRWRSPRRRSSCNLWRCDCCIRWHALRRREQRRPRYGR